MLTHEGLPGPAPGVDPTTLEALMCRAGLAVAVVDGTGCLSMLSPNLEHLLHRPFARVPAESLAEVFHLYSEGGDRLLLAHEVPIVRAARGETVDDAIITVKTPGQPVRHLRVNAAPVLGSDGTRQGAWALMADVTTLVAAARGELSRSLVETVNHNLRTPLTTILGHAELLHDQLDDLPVGAVRSLEALLRASRRLDEVVKGIADWIDVAYTTSAGATGTDLAEHLGR